MNQLIHLHTALAAALVLSACSSADIKASDHDVLYLDARVRKHLDGSDDHAGPFAELGWTSAHGDTDQLDYSIGIANLSGGWEQPLGKHFSIAGSAGFAWQLNDFDIDAGPLAEDNGFGGYVSFEGGWRATSWLEPCGRIVGTQSFNEFASTEMYELGARFYFIEHTSLFVGYRDASYDIDDIDSALNISSIELDTTGPVISLLVSF